MHHHETHSQPTITKEKYLGELDKLEIDKIDVALVIFTLLMMFTAIIYFLYKLFKLYGN